MILRRDGNLEYYQFELLAAVPGLRHAIFTRRGGFSEGPCAGLNVGRSVGDDPASVDRNREMIGDCLGGVRLQFLRQVHGSEVVIIEESCPQDRPPPVGDAMVTGESGICLTIQVADCQPVLVCDPRRRVVANIHSGWRGSVNNIVGRTVETLIDRFDCDPNDLLAGIGPSLGPCCAEFVNYRSEIPPELWQYRDGRDRFDFWEISRSQLRRAGLADSHIEVGGQCTRCRPDMFFSYRAEGSTGRFAAAIALE